jgi:antitoxin component of RelBE/YafQ-DinJ toxin-antitoxin module
MFDIFSTPSKPSKEEQVYFTIKLPLPLRDQFNAVCAKHQISASEAVRRFMTQAIAEDAAK